ncbi:unnamed protein product, partial [marine sediment metagenome]
MKNCNEVERLLKILDNHNIGFCKDCGSDEMKDYLYNGYCEKCNKQQSVDFTFTAEFYNEDDRWNFRKELESFLQSKLTNNVFAINTQ